MSVHRYHEDWWRIDLLVRLPDGSTTRVRKAAGTQSRLEALERQEQERAKAIAEWTKAEAARQAGTRPTMAPPRIEDFAREYLETHARHNNSARYHEDKERILDGHLVPFFRGRRLDEIGTFEIDRYKAEKSGGEKPLSAKTVNNHLTVLRHLLMTAHRWEKLATVPAFDWLEVEPPEFDFLDFSEAERLLTAADGEWRTMILVGLRCGLREGELCGLRWDDVDLVAGRLVVRRTVEWLRKGRIQFGLPKSGRTREVPLSPQVVDALKSHRHLRGDLVFCQAGGEVLTKGLCKHPLWRACRRAGLRRVGWHVLRHTFASHLAMRGVPIKVVQELLGHATIEMTMRYAHLSPAASREAVALLDSGGPFMAGRDHQRPTNVREASGNLWPSQAKSVEAPGVEPGGAVPAKPKDPA